MKPNPIEMVIEFIGLVVITETDNWIGEWITKVMPEEKDNIPANDDVEDDHLGLFEKLSMLKEDLYLYHTFCEGKELHADDKSKSHDTEA